MKTLRLTLGVLAIAGIAACHSHKPAPGPYGNPPGMPAVPGMPRRWFAQAAPGEQPQPQPQQTVVQGSAPDAQISAPTPAPFVTATPDPAMRPPDNQTGPLTATSAGLPSAATPTATPAG